MRRAAALAVGLATVAVPGASQSTADTLAHARRLYDQLEIERAVPVLRRVLSSAWPLPVTPEEQVEALTYLGASFALIGQGDSATAAFRRLIEHDPFATLDPQRFTPAQIALFAQAGRRTLVVAARPVRAQRVDPRTERVGFAITSSHAVSLRVELRSPGVPAPIVVVFTGESTGPREVPWDGLAAGGSLAPPGRYEVAVLAQSRSLGRSDSARVYFELRHGREALEDTLPALGPGDLLPEQRSTSTALADLAKGLVVAAGVLLAGSMASDDLGGAEGSLVAVGAGAAAVTGGVAFVYGRRHGAIPANVAANAERRTERTAENAARRTRNAERIARTVLIVEPAAGGGR